VSARFHAPGATAPGDLVILSDEEARHLSKVLRLHVGDDVRLFNGHGAEFDGRVEQVGSGTVQVRVGGARLAAPEPRVAITLAAAVLKGDKMDDVVRDAVMIGVATIQPLITTRAEVTLASLQRSHRRERWQRIAISAAKQCGRAVVPPVAEPQPFDSLPAAIAGMQWPGPALMFVEPGATTEALPLGEIDARPPKEATVLVGPEGGWTPAEVEVGAGVSRLVSLGGRTLRADAMPIVAVAALFAVWKEY
jgi:16S rRNA (uracil1498-N3)-methyltransferase